MPRLVDVPSVVVDDDLVYMIVTVRTAEAIRSLFGQCTTVNRTSSLFRLLGSAGINSQPVINEPSLPINFRN